MIDSAADGTLTMATFLARVDQLDVHDDSNKKETAENVEALRRAFLQTIKTFEKMRIKPDDKRRLYKRALLTMRAESWENNASMLNDKGSEMEISGQKENADRAFSKAAELMMSAQIMRTILQGEQWLRWVKRNKRINLARSFCQICIQCVDYWADGGHGNINVVLTGLGFYCPLSSNQNAGAWRWVWRRNLSVSKVSQLAEEDIHVTRISDDDADQEDRDYDPDNEDDIEDDEIFLDEDGDDLDPSEKDEETLRERLGDTDIDLNIIYPLIFYGKTKMVS